MSDMTLWQIDETIAQLVSLREDVETDEERAAIDGQLQEWMATEVVKVTRVRGYIRHCQAMSAAAKEEKDRLYKLQKMWDAREQRVREMVQWVMEQQGKRKLEGITGSLSLRRNGGVQAVLVDNDGLVPDDYRLWTFRLPAKLWHALQRLLSEGDIGQIIQRAMLATASPSIDTPALRTALEADVFVPGAHLADRGESLVVR